MEFLYPNLHSHFHFFLLSFLASFFFGYTEDMHYNIGKILRILRRGCCLPAPAVRTWQDLGRFSRLPWFFGPPRRSKTNQDASKIPQEASRSRLGPSNTKELDWKNTHFQAGCAHFWTQEAPEGAHDAPKSPQEPPKTHLRPEAL